MSVKELPLGAVERLHRFRLHTFHWRDNPYLAYLYILPGLALYAVFVLYPIVQTVRYSFYEWTGFSAPVFIGLDNYRALLSDARFLSALGNNFYFILFYTILPILLGLFLTSLLTRGRLWGMAFFRVGLFLPQVLSPVVVGIIWRWIFSYNGPVNELLLTIGLDGWVKPWLGDFDWALPATGTVGTWYEYGLCMVLFIAGVQAIGEELYDAAKVDGANAFRQFIHITLPGLRQQILVAFVMTFIAALRVFGLVFVLTRGGPGQETEVTTMLIYEQTFRFRQAGYGTAMAVVLSVIITGVAVLAIVLQARQERDR